jgi:hypothetical protein
VKAPALTGESTWTTPMIRSSDQSGAHMAARIWWMRTDSPPGWSAWAS